MRIMGVQLMKPLDSVKAPKSWRDITDRVALQNVPILYRTPPKKGYPTNRRNHFSYVGTKEKETISILKQFS